MSIKLIVSDLDGTMLNARYEIHADNLAAVREAMARGVRVTIATGRMFVAALPFARQLGLAMPLIAYNGALIRTMDGADVFALYLSPPLVARLLRFVFAQGWYVQLYSDERLYYRESTPAAREYEAITGVCGHAVGEDGLLARTDRVTKLLLIRPTPAEADAALAALHERFPGEIATSKSVDNYVEVVHPEVSKGKAVVELAARCGIAPEEIMALGDGGNDVPMLAACGLGVAMGNARPRVQAVAKAITGLADEGGVAQAIRKYVLA